MSNKKKTFFQCLSLIFTSLVLFTASADEKSTSLGEESLLNKLLAPGKLIQGHQKLESDCFSCHTARKGIPDSKCLDCHKELKPFIEKKSGFHGLAKPTCIKCHSDHKDREYDSVQIDQKTFDHSTTGYKLEEKHKDLKCQECHIEKRSKSNKFLRPSDIRYFGLTTTCKSCHKKDDIHFFKGKYEKEDCNKCHTLKTWKDSIKFDHTRDTGYKLEGKHVEAKCAKCHVPSKTKPSIYTWPKLKFDKCLSCHEDQHGKNVSKRFQNGDCTKCHTQKGWKIEKFDHSITDYPLRGSHAKLDCTKCHIQGMTGSFLQAKKAPPKVQPLVSSKHFKFVGLKQNCVSCHEDFHGFGKHRSKKIGALEDCLTCHNETKWKPANGFNHNVDTGFEIGGKHVGVSCEKCHVWAQPQFKGSIRTRVYHWETLGTKTCEVCHKSPHLKTFSPKLLAKKCTDCHTDEGWKVTKKDKIAFNHDQSTRFKITGSHKPLNCNACHVVNNKQVYKFEGAESGFCTACHKNQHIDQFKPEFASKNCTDCHDTDKFAKLMPFDHTKTDFKIDGKHSKLKCAECHTPTNEIFETKTHRRKGLFIFKSADQKYCIDCHKNVHVGQFHAKFSSKSCTECHTTNSFDRRLAFNHSTTDFALKGKHETVKCEKCHTETRSLLRAKPPKFAARFLFPEIPGANCKTCHKDPHNGSYGAKCSECHNELGWKKTSDFHKNFTLSGVHFSLECSECHRDDRRLGGMSDNCALCHQKDDIHNGTLPNCKDCHRQQFWENAEFKHSMSNFPLRGAHRTLECVSCHSNGVYLATPSQCVDCHRADALAFGGTPNHSLLLNQNCANCHNQFSFR